MRKFIFLFSSLFFLSILTIRAQVPECSKFKNGKFKMTYSGKTAYITRSGAVQTELIPESHIKATYKVTWLDDCTYTLTPTAATLTAYPTMPEEMVMTVQIIKTTNDTYTQVTTSNMSNKMAKGELVKLN